MKTRYFAFKVELDGKVPDTIHLIPFGRWRERRHNFAFDETDAQMVLDNFKKSAVDTVIDYEHQTLNTMFNGQAAPAAGWIKELEIKDDGVWCIDLEWTKKAKEYLQNKEYKYLSPVIEFDSQDRETGKNTGPQLHSVGLTNVPFLEELNPVVNKFSHRDTEIFSNAKRTVKTHHIKTINEKAWDKTKAIKQLRKWASKDGSGDKESMDWSKYRLGFALYDDEDIENFAGYKLPHHYVENGKLVLSRKGVFAAMGALKGARGGVDVGEAKKAVYNHLAAHYTDLDAKPPEFKKLINSEEEFMDFAELQEKYDGLVAKDATLEKEKKDAEVKLKEANDKIAAAAVAAAEKEAETIVSKAIEGKLIQKNQKEWALELCKKNRKDFDKYLETLKPAETTKDEAEIIVNKAIEDKLILPALKDWAVNLCVLNKEMFENYLKVCTPHNLIDLKDLNLGQGRVEAYEPEVRK